MAEETAVAGTKTTCPEPPNPPGPGGGSTSAESPVAARGVRLPSTKKCVSRRKFRIRDPSAGRHQDPSAIVYVNGRRVKTVKRPVFNSLRTTATVDLRGLPKGTFRIRIQVHTTKGRFLTGPRRYKTCVKKKLPKRLPNL